MTLEEARKQLIEWSWRGKHASKDHLHIEMIEREDRPYVRLTLFTVTNSYGIRAFPPSGDDKGYLGCEFSMREPLPGETWTRGGDLSDGSFNAVTWQRIMDDILSVELALAHEEEG